MLWPLPQQCVSVDSVFCEEKRAAILLPLSVCMVVVPQLVLDAQTVRMPSLPESTEGVPGNAQGLFEVCVCPSGKLFLSKAEVTSTCSENQEC